MNGASFAKKSPTSISGGSFYHELDNLNYESIDLVKKVEKYNVILKDEDILYNIHKIVNACETVAIVAEYKYKD